MLARTPAILPYTPTTDLTGKEGFFVEPNGTGVSVVNAATDIPLGVVTEGRPAAAKSSIALNDGGVPGTVKVKLSATPGAVVVGSYLVLDGATLGTVKLDPGAGGRTRVARACEPGAANELIEAVLISPVALT